VKHVLIVDDEGLFTRSMAEGLAALDPTLQVSTAADGRLAMGLLESQPIDLVVTDLQMPEMDGFELLAYLSRRFPLLPVLVMTAFGTPDLEARLHSLGVDRYIEKPIDFDTLAGKIAGILAHGASGHVRGITLPTFAQILEVERKTCTLKVTCEGRQARLFFKEGVLMDAEADGQSGESAALEVLAWPEAGIEITGDCPMETRRVTSPLAELLLESLRRQDEGPERVGAATAAPTQHHQPPRDRAPGAHARKESAMSAQDKLKDLASVEGSREPLSTRRRVRTWRCSTPATASRPRSECSPTRC